MQISSLVCTGGIKEETNSAASHHKKESDISAPATMKDCRLENLLSEMCCDTTLRRIFEVAILASGVHILNPIFNAKNGRISAFMPST